ncbi:hypothetical protein LCGC14_2006780 [marine sediment metagenome]|uniref:Uncharacterized protein n=3 Tax=marine sediment metagenome TaxID=412755 RepID=A0A0F9FP53_9ZZZZ
MAVNSVTTSNVRWYNGNPTGDGVGLGKTALSKVGFYGITPVVQAAITAVGTTTATTALNETKIDRLYAALELVGIIATGG